MDIGCTLKLTEDADRNAPTRVSEITVAVDGKHRSGSWSLVSNSADPRIAVTGSSGIWFVGNGDGDVSTLYIARRSDQRILFELYGVTQGTLSDMHCGSGYGGQGWHQGPPSSDVAFSLWFGCA